jgi:hypothetical protein
MHLLDNPTPKHLEEINRHLFNQKRKEQVGFFVNFEDIESRFKKDQLVCVFEGDSMLGYFCWWEDCENVFIIDLFEIFYAFRRNGFGTNLANACLRFLANKKAKMVKLTAALDSEQFWYNMGFQLNEEETTKNTVKLFKTIT